MSLLENSDSLDLLNSNKVNIDQLRTDLEEFIGSTTPKIENTSIKFGGNYKIALDSMTALTAGVSYTMVSGKGLDNGNAFEYDTNNTLAIVAGFERALSSNIVLTADIDLYSQNTVKMKSAGATETKTTKLFEDVSFGVAYLF